MSAGGGAATPASLVLVHGAGSGPWVFDGWDAAFPGVELLKVDLHTGLDVARASHGDYARVVTAAARSLRRPVALCGWSMGGLVVLDVAQAIRPTSVVLLEPSPPAEVQGRDSAVEPRAGTFDPEEAYGRFPVGVLARPESSLARAERKRGLSVPSLPCPSLVVYGNEFASDRGVAIARAYGSDELHFADLDHWALVSDGRVCAAVARWLGVGA